MEWAEGLGDDGKSPNALEIRANVFAGLCASCREMTMVPFYLDRATRVVLSRMSKLPTGEIVVRIGIREETRQQVKEVYGGNR